MVKKKFAQRKKTIEIEPYGYHLHVSVSNDILRAFSKSRVAKLVVKPPTESTVAFIWKRSGCTDVFMFLPSHKVGGRPDLDMVAHESYHIAFFVLTESGVDCTDSAEEAWAYLIGYLTQEVHDFLKAKK